MVTIRVGGVLVLSGCGLLAAGLACAQAPPGPLQPAPSSVSNAPPSPPIKRIPPRKTIMGDWKLNHEDSDDPRSKMRQAGAKNDNHRNTSGPQVGWPGGGGMGGPYGGPRNPNGNNYPESDPNAAYEKVQSLVDPSIRMHLVQRDPKQQMVELTGDQGRKMVFYTDGKLPDKPSDPNMQMIVAHWDGNKLVTDEKLEKNGTLTRTYELSEDGLQLFEEVHLVTGKKKESPVTIHYVYDASEAEVEY